MPFLRSHGLRRGADPAGLDPRGDHAAAGRARQARPAPGLAAPTQGREAQPTPGRGGRGWSTAAAGSPPVTGVGDRRCALAIAATSLRLGSPVTQTRSPLRRAKQGLWRSSARGIGDGSAATRRRPGRRPHDRRTWPRELASARDAWRRRCRRAAEWRRTVPRSSKCSQSPTADRRRRGDAAARAPRGAPSAPDGRVGGTGRPAKHDFDQPRSTALSADDRADRASLTFVLLARAFRSLLLPLKAVVLNMRQHRRRLRRAGAGLAGGLRLASIWGIPATGSITFWMPLMVFAFLFGLSMDYEVFILTRMREEYDRTGVNRRRGHRGNRPHRPAGHQRRADPVPRLHLAGGRAR